MPFTFQYNKTSQHQLGKQLKMRQAALPVLKNKESALRVEVARYRAERERIQVELEALQEQAKNLHALLGPFPMSLFLQAEPVMSRRKIAGVLIPVFESLTLAIKPSLLHSMPPTQSDVVLFLRQWALVLAQEHTAARQVTILERERKRTTQKVNLYEKVQIPQMEEALKKIKRYLEDEQNLAKSAQKLVKARKESA
ncbi:MAG: V-type ATP synthase subunit D [Bacteroidetes bacterium]|nr:V-type ATP synthase subunit D [Bacteroidota bacterium]